MSKTLLCMVRKCYVLSVHREQELLVGVRLHQTVADGAHGLDGVHLGNELTDNPHAVERSVIMQQIVAACRRLNEVDGREDTLVGERAVELDFRVTCTL